MKLIKVESWRAHEYFELRKVTAYKSGRIFKTEYCGYVRSIHVKPAGLYDILKKRTGDYILGSISTKLLKKKCFLLNVLDIEEISKL